MQKRSIREANLKEIVEAIIYYTTKQRTHTILRFLVAYMIYFGGKKHTISQRAGFQPKEQVNWDIFWLMPPNSFQQIVRMNKETFNSICRPISQHLVFHNNFQAAFSLVCFVWLFLRDQVGIVDGILFISVRSQLLMGKYSIQGKEGILMQVFY